MIEHSLEPHNKKFNHPQAYRATVFISASYFVVSVTRVCTLNCFSLVRLLGMLWTVAHQAPLSMGFSRQKYWSGLPCPPLGDLPNPEIEPVSLTSPLLAGGLFTTSATWGALNDVYIFKIDNNRNEQTTCWFGFFPSSIAS